MAREKSVTMNGRRPYSPVRKLCAVRRADYNCPRRQVPSIKRLKSERLEYEIADRALIRDLMLDAADRAELQRSMGVIQGPMSVWLETYHPYDIPRAPAKRLARWDKLSQRMKLFIAWDVGMEFGTAYTFTSHIDPEMLERWEGPEAIRENVEQRIYRAVREQGIGDLPICYVLESRNASGRSRTRPHLHGFALCDQATDATKLKVAIERALNPNLKRHGRTREVHLKPANQETVPYRGRDNWPKYMIKNATRYDRNLVNRRSYVSRSLTYLAREAWAVRREE